MYIMDIDKIHGFRETGYYFQKTNGRPLSNLLHSHTFYEFLYIASGSCTHYADGTQQKLHAGNLIVLTPHSQHRFLSQSENADVIALSVVCEEVDNFFSLYGINDFSASSFVLELSIEQQQTLLSMYENVIYSEVEEYITRLRMVLNQMFLFCMSPIFQKAYIPPYFADILDKMQELELAAEGISAFLRLSEYSHSQLCRLTKKYLGITPSEYINRIRMSHAYKLIVYGDMDYETICSTVGFESFSYFCRLVKENFGCSAAKLRKSSKDIRKTV